MNRTSRDEIFFNEIYEHTFNNLRKYIVRRCNDPLLVDDVLQEVYLEAYRHIEDLKRHENSVGWIYKTAENKVKKLNNVYYKLIANETAYNKGIEEISKDNDIESPYIIYEEYRRILKEDEYNLLMKKYCDGYSHSDLARMTGTTVAGSKMRMSRIIKKLQRNIKIRTFLFLIVCSLS